jgi:hypothetical protein
VTVTGTIANVNSAFTGGVTYTPNNNSFGTDTLTVVINDGGNTGSPGPLTDTKTVAITVNSVNDAPVNSVPGPQTVIKDQNLTLSSATANAIQTSDVDAGSANIQVAISATNGTVTISSPGGTNVTGNGTGTATLTGSVTAINAALAAGVVYRNNPGFTGSETLTVVTNDLGNSGSGGPRTDTDTIAITIQDFVPSEIGGSVFVDSNQNGARDAAEPGLASVSILLTGTDINGAAVNETQLTDSHGSYLFSNIKPGTYRLLQGRVENGQIVKVQPAGMLDGAESFQAALSPSGNDEATVTITTPGGLQSLGNLFGEHGLEAIYARAFDLLASSGDPANGSGIVIGTNAAGTWSLYRGTAWENYENARVTILSTSTVNGHKHAVVRLTVFDKTLGHDRSTVLDSSTNSRLIYIESNGTSVIRFRGRPDIELPLAAQGEGESAQWSNPEEAARNYEQSVDEVMARSETAFA